MMSSAIVDLDGTLSDKSHREHLIEKGEKQWRTYLERSVEDPVNKEVRDFVEELNQKHRINIITMRSGEVREETVKWLKKHEIQFENLIMLPEGRWKVKDSEFKKEKLKELEKPVLAIDDKKSNCEMFREEGLQVYTVENGSPIPYST